MTAANPKSLRVFLVENDADTLKYFRMYLEDEGHRVWDARSVAEALAKIPKVECDVLISDVGLADGTGWELMEKLRERGLQLPPYAIAMSGFGMNADRAKSNAAGFRHHLLKPFDIDDLDEILKEASRELFAEGSG
jgi:CheY-like chemotaxis protein